MFLKFSPLVFVVITFAGCSRSPQTKQTEAQDPQTTLRKAAQPENHKFQNTQSALVREQSFDENTPLETLREAATGGSQAAKTLLATRLIRGTARTPQVMSLLENMERSVNDFIRKGYFDGHYDGHVVYIENFRIEDLNRTLKPTPEAREWKEQLLKRIDQYTKFKASVVENDTKEALELLNTAASQNNIYSMLILANLYSDGKRIPQNPDRAFTLTKRAAESGNPIAMTSLGVLYAKGFGVTMDIMEAVKLFESACEKGDALGCCYAAGVFLNGGIGKTDAGHPKNMKRAYVLGRAIQLTSIPVDNIRKRADDIVDKARQELSPDQLIAAETEAGNEAKRLASFQATTEPCSQPLPDLTNSRAFTKEQWKKLLGQANPFFAVSGHVQMPKAEFLKMCGEPQDSQTIGDNAFWYYSCKNGAIQLELNKGSLLAGYVIGRVNDY